MRQFDPRPARSRRPNTQGCARELHLAGTITDKPPFCSPHRRPAAMLRGVTYQGTPARARKAEIRPQPDGLGPDSRPNASGAGSAGLLSDQAVPARICFSHLISRATEPGFREHRGHRLDRQREPDQGRGPHCFWNCRQMEWFSPPWKAPARRHATGHQSNDPDLQSDPAPTWPPR